MATYSVPIQLTGATLFKGGKFFSGAAFELEERIQELLQSGRRQVKEIVPFKDNSVMVILEDVR